MLTDHEESVVFEAKHLQHRMPVEIASIDTVSSSTELDESDSAGSDFINLNMGIGKKFHNEWFSKQPLHEVEKLPEDINGLCKYKVQCTLGTYVHATDDRRWFSMSTSSKKKKPNENFVWKNGRCQGSFICGNKNGSFLKTGGCANETNFTTVSAEERGCFSCGVLALRKKCNAFKRIEFHVDDNYALIYHVGNHTCHLSQPRKSGHKKLLRAMRSRGVSLVDSLKQVALEEIIGKIQQEDVSGVDEVAEMYSDFRDVAKAQKDL